MPALKSAKVSTATSEAASAAKAALTRSGRRNRLQPLRQGTAQQQPSLSCQKPRRPSRQDAAAIKTPFAAGTTTTATSSLWMKRRRLANCHSQHLQISVIGETTGGTANNVTTASAAATSANNSATPTRRSSNSIEKVHADRNTPKQTQSTDEDTATAETDDGTADGSAPGETGRGSEA